MKDPQTEIEELRAGVNCATVLETSTPPWRLDRAESSQKCLKYRRGVGEIVIVTHEGAGWWDPNSDAKGDVFHLVQHLEPRLNFGEVRKVLRPLAGIRPDFTGSQKKEKHKPPIPIAERWERRPRLRRHTDVWRYLSGRGLSETVLFEAAHYDTVREGPHSSAWFAHRNSNGLVIHVDIRGPTYKGSLTGGNKSLFLFQDDAKRRRNRFVLAEAPIDALSLANLEHPRQDTIYAATGGGMSPNTIQAIMDHLLSIKGLPNPQFDSATDANSAGDRYAARHAEFAHKIGVPFHRLRPEIEGQDWNDVLKSKGKIQ